MTWNYRILRHTHTPDVRERCGEAYYYQLHEVFYDETGRPYGYTENAIDFGCGEDEGPEGIVASLEMALRDARKWPVIDVAETWPVTPPASPPQPSLSGTGTER